ncbi:phage portal protein [Methanoregula sp.]|uniref:phage portal protein n=1 Tax=Methanoregula sp. TaxID=2052170 RepID=UPI0035696FB3
MSAKGILQKLRMAAQAGSRSFSRVMKAPSVEEATIQAQMQARQRTLKGTRDIVKQTSRRYLITDDDYEEYEEKRLDAMMNDPVRRAIFTVNSYLNVFGIPRRNFWKQDNDRLARNAIYAVCEKRIMDTIETAEWEVIDGKKQTVEAAEAFLKKPNPQGTWQSLIKPTIPDMLRYDQAVWVKTRNLAGHLLEVKAYSGPEFWIEVDNSFSEIMGQFGLFYYGPWSHGYVKRYWQHSKPGVYIPFSPRDICFIMMYPRSDDIYGTDFLQQLKWQLEYQIDSTKAAGMMFANGIGPSLWWRHPGYSSIDQLEERNFEVELENKGPENFGNILHLLGEEEVGTIFPALMNSQWLEGQKWISTIIWAMFGFSASEFTSDDVNRATAYINQNITKSKMLAPILKHLETVINTEILPELEGYQPDWHFQFKPVIDLDDQLKEVQVAQGKADVAGKWVALGAPLETAMKIAKMDDEDIEAVSAGLDQVTPGQNASMEDALQSLKDAAGAGKVQDLHDQIALPDKGSNTHIEGYSGIARNDSGKPETSKTQKAASGWAYNDNAHLWTHLTDREVFVQIIPHEDKFFVVHAHPGPDGAVLQPPDQTATLEEAKKKAKEHVDHWYDSSKWKSDPDYGKLEPGDT